MTAPPVTDVITSLDDVQLAAWEDKAEAAVRAALNHVLGVVAGHIGKTVTSSAALVAADPGEPYVSPDDLAAITPLWQQQVDDTLLPLVGQVYTDSAGTLHTSLVDATGLSELPTVTPLAAQTQLAAAANSFEQVGAQAWETARSELLDGFAAGESIPQLAGRLRDSAGMTATRATLVARTQVLDASNAGSYDTAKASGLDLLKGWEATPDFRTRETHLQAGSTYSGPGMIGLDAMFMVGGWPCLRPHDPELPPAERYNCRCSLMYQIREPGQIERMRLEQEAQRQRVEEGLAEQRRAREAIIEEQRQRLAATLEEQRRQLERSFEEIRRGRTVAKAIPDTGPSPAAMSGRVTEIVVRPSLQAADTVAEVRRVFVAEWAALIRPQGLVGPQARFLAAADVQTVREEAEALLRAIEWFPRAPLAVSHGPNPHYAQTEDVHVIVFSNAYAKDRQAFLQSLLSGGLRNQQGYVWHPMSTASPGGVAMHEFGHVLHHALSPLEPITPGDLTAFKYSTRIDDLAEKIAKELAAERDITVDELIRTEIGVYAAEGQAGAAVRTPELIAESFADAMVNGDAASVLSKRIFAMLVDEYDKALPSRVPRLPGMALPKAAPRVVVARPGSTIGDVELGPTQLEQALGEAPVIRPPVGDFVDRPYLGPGGAVLARGQSLPADFRSELTTIRRGEFQIRPGLTLEESQALDRYALSRVADPLNAGLRRGELSGFGTVRIAEQIVDLDQELAQLDSAIAAGRLAQDTMLYRGALMRPADIGRLQIGAVTRESGFLSTTTEWGNAFQIINWRQATAPPGRSRIIFKILAPKGTNAATAHAEELEVLLARGLRLRVVDILRPTRPGDMRVITLEIVGGEPAPVEFGLLGRTIGEALVQLDAGTDLSNIVALFAGDPALRKALLAARRATDRDKLALALRRLADREGITIPTPAQLRAIKTAERRAAAQAKREATALARAEKAKAAQVKAQVKEVEAGQFQHLQQITPNVYQGPDGTRWFVAEYRTEKAAREQALAAVLRDLLRADRTATPDLVAVVGRQAQGLRGWQVAYRGVATDPGDVGLEDWLTAGGLDRLNRLTPAKIRALVARYGLDPDVADRLIAARADALLRAKLGTRPGKVGVLPRQRPGSPRRAAQATNPHYGTTTANPTYRQVAQAGDRWTPDLGPPPSGAYEENCSNVVNAFEMRMRGYDVTAAPLDILNRYGYAAGRTYSEMDQLLADGWRLSNGAPHGRSLAGQAWRTFAEIDEEIAQFWPDGGRGIIFVGKHIFNVIKVGGKAQYYEGQFDVNASRIVTSLYKKKYGSSMSTQQAKLMRLDDLEPADGILQALDW